MNFTVTRGSLQSQCLNEVLKAERPEVDAKRSDLLKLQGIYPNINIYIYINIYKNIYVYLFFNGPSGCSKKERVSSDIFLHFDARGSIELR